MTVLCAQQKAACSLVITDGGDGSVEGERPDRTAQAGRPCDSARPFRKRQGTPAAARRSAYAQGGPALHARVEKLRSGKRALAREALRREQMDGHFADPASRQQCERSPPEDHERHAVEAGTWRTGAGARPARCRPVPGPNRDRRARSLHGSRLRSCSTHRTVGTWEPIRRASACRHGIDSPAGRAPFP